MLDLSIHQLTEIVGGQLSLGTMGPLGGGMEPIGRIVTDSRKVLPGDLFWGLEGRVTDGAQFAEEALIRAAQGTVVAGRHIEPWAGRFSIRVRDARRALLKLGHWTRRHFPGTVIGTTGDPHSTLTASLTHQLLQSSMSGVCGDMPLRDETALALAMLNWHDEREYAILDIGPANSPKIAEISHLCSPRIIAINSPRKITHHQSPRDRKAFAEIHAKFLDTVPRDTIIVINADDPSLREAARNCSLETIRVGRGGDSDMMATNVCCRDGQLAFDVEETRFQLPIWGRHYLPQALIAIAIGKLLSVPLDAMQAAARKVRLPQGFGDVRSIAGIVVIDDSRAASPASLETGLESLSEMPTPGRRWVVCGDLNMDDHDAVGRCRELGRMLVTRCSADRLICCGAESVDIADAAVAAGMPRRSVSVCPTGLAAVDRLAAELAPSDVVLVSDNRSVDMKIVIQHFAARWPSAAA